MRPEEDTKQGPPTLAGEEGEDAVWAGKPHQQGLFRSGDSEMLCWEEGRSEQFVAFLPLPPLVLCELPP